MRRIRREEGEGPTLRPDGTTGDPLVDGIMGAIDNAVLRLNVAVLLTFGPISAAILLYAYLTGGFSS